MNAIRSRCLGSMLAWILKMKPENLSPSTGTSRERAAGDGAARLRRDGVLEEPVEQELDPEVVDRAPEVDGRLPARPGPPRGRTAWPAPSSMASCSPTSAKVESSSLARTAGSSSEATLTGARYAPPGTRSKRWTCLDRRSKTPRNEGPLPSGQTTGDAWIPSTASSSSRSAIGLRVGRSNLFMNVKIGMPRRRQTSKSLRVWASTPLAASITMRTASTAVSTR